ncbi:MAG: V-type ATP synthase subunit A [Deferrisomatales bacterium]
MRISGSTVAASGLEGAGLYHRVEVGQARLAGEIIRLDGEVATVQVYESTWGLRVGEPVEDTGRPFSVTLGPGLLGSVFDGIQRPLPRILEEQGPFLGRGAAATFLGDPRRWEVEPVVGPGDAVGPGEEVARVQETPALVHRVLCPPETSGAVSRVFGGPRTLADPVCELADGTTIRLAQHWPCRVPRPHRGKLSPEQPCVTGQRVIDCFFPLAQGGLAVVPGGFGTGKTVLEQALAKHLDVDVIVYVGCGERGNEMTEILREFTALEDPRTGRPLMERTVLVANTSNMPVAAREASIYTGITLAEYYRDMGYRVALLADSVSRWAEALREISSRLEELPGEEGYPSYLASRLGQFYERAGRVRCLGGAGDGALSVVAAVSPPGGDLSEPVTQASLRMAGCFWALDPALASQRHYPAVDWRESFTLYREFLRGAWEERGGPGWHERCGRLGELLAHEEAVREIAQLVGYDALQDAEKFALEAGRGVREGFLQQDATHPMDGFCPPEKARLLMDLLLALFDRARQRIAREGAEVSAERAALAEVPRLRYLSTERLRRMLEEVKDGGPPPSR